jgi:hypothetical protein
MSMDKYIVEKYIDFDIIESYKKPITMPAKYLEVFSVVRSMSVIISRYISAIRCWCI